MVENDSKALWLETHEALPEARVELGRAASDAFRTDPKMLGFIAGRYKFVAKMLDGKATVLEVGCGDAFGAPVVAQSVGRLICTDIDEATLTDDARRLSFVTNASFEYFDFRSSAYGSQVDAVYCIDVIEHVFPEEEPSFFSNLVASIVPGGVAIVGTPNRAAEAHASAYSKKCHVNLKDHKMLRALAAPFFDHVFLFSMNDEVLHTGYYPMAHYLWALCVGRKS